MKILMVLTSHDKLGDPGRNSGSWLEGFAAPYYTFLDAGAAVTLASPKGGHATAKTSATGWSRRLKSARTNPLCVACGRSQRA